MADVSVLILAIRTWDWVLDTSTTLVIRKSVAEPTKRASAGPKRAHVSCVQSDFTSVV